MGDRENGHAGEPSQFLREQAERLFAFCALLAEREDDAEEIAMATLGDFGESHRRWVHEEPPEATAREARVALFQAAWERFGTMLPALDAVWYGGRDTRPWKAFDEDLFEQWRKGKRDVVRVLTPALVRLRRIDPQLRATVVLRDVLSFDDEEVVRILGVRWGVYRHRLHRGRLDCIDLFRGLKAETRGVDTSSHLAPQPGLS